MNDSLLAHTLQLVANCLCLVGCPSCVGPVGEVGKMGKEVALAILYSVVSGVNQELTTKDNGQRTADD